MNHFFKNVGLDWYKNVGVFCFWKIFLWVKGLKTKNFDKLLLFLKKYFLRHRYNLTRHFSLKEIELWILLDKKSKFEISKVYTIRLQKYMGIRKFEFVAKTQLLCFETINFAILFSILVCLTLFSSKFFFFGNKVKS